MALLVAVAAIVGVSACSENLDSSAACPSLCPGQSVTLQDTILPAIAIDSSVPGFPAIGQEPFLLVAGRGDTLETRGIIRFDSLPLVFHRTNAAADSAITAVDSAYIRFQLDTGGVKPGAPVTISLFDVDTTAADTVTSALAGLFRPDRFLGSATFAPESLVDSIKVPISNAILLHKITDSLRLRVGIQVVGTNHAEVRLGTVNGGTSALLEFKPAAHGDTTGVTVSTQAPVSTTPVGSAITSALADYLIVLKGTIAEPPGILALGGVPGRRIYFSFNLPSQIVDSSTVVRATLMLTQVPNPFSPDARDSAKVYPQAVVAGSAVTDVGRALELLGAPGTAGLDTTHAFAPADSGLRQFEMVQLVRSWSSQLAAGTTRALAMRSSIEGTSGATYWFFSSEAPLALRPKVRLTYAPRRSAGNP